MILSVSFKQNE